METKETDNGIGCILIVIAFLGLIFGLRWIYLHWNLL